MQIFYKVLIIKLNKIEKKKVLTSAGDILLPLGDKQMVVVA